MGFSGWGTCKDVLWLKVLDLNEKSKVTETAGEETRCKQQQVFSTDIEGGTERFHFVENEFVGQFLHEIVGSNPK